MFQLHQGLQKSGDLVIFFFLVGSLRGMDKLRKNLSAAIVGKSIPASTFSMACHVGCGET
jgi:hypothetical protein